MRPIAPVPVRAAFARCNRVGRHPHLLHIAMKHIITRRKLLQAGAAASASLLIGPAAMARTYSANEKIRFALVGIGGMGGKGVGVASNEQIVAAADVDFNHAGGSLKTIKGKFPDAKIYTDYRKLFDEQEHLDAAWVATPDHNHFPASIPRWTRGWPCTARSRCATTFTRPANCARWPRRKRSPRRWATRAIPASPCGCCASGFGRAAWAT